MQQGSQAQESSAMIKLHQESRRWRDSGMRCQQGLDVECCGFSEAFLSFLCCMAVSPVSAFGVYANSIQLRPVIAFEWLQD